LINYPSAMDLTSYTIPDSVTNILRSAFQGCMNITSITMSDNVKTIGDTAFFGCSNLTDVKIGNGVTNIGFRTFTLCTSLSSVTIPDSVTSIDSYAFENCTGLTNVTLGSGITSIGGYMFKGCRSLTDVVVPNSITSINEYAFSGCTGLTSVTISNSTTNISNCAFYYCTALKDVYYNSTKEQWEAITIGSYNSNLTEATIHCTDGVINPPHEHSYNSVVTPPTCTEQGYTTHTCECGESYVDTYVDALGHKSDKGTVTKKATYTATGVKTYKCTVCGKVLKTETLAKLPKKANTLVAKGKTATVKFANLKKKNQTVTQKNAFVVSKAQGKVTYKKASGNAKITVSSAGKLTVKKGLKKGTYKIKVKVTAAGNTTYKAVTKTVTVTIKVK